MTIRDARTLEALASAIAEGESVDWDAATESLRSREAMEVAGGLRTLAAIRSNTLSRSRTLSRGSRAFAAFRSLALLHVAGGLLALFWVPRDRGPIPPALLAMNAIAFAVAALALPLIRPAQGRLRDLAGVFFAIAAACSHRPLRWLIEAGHGAWPLVLLRGLLPDAFLAFFLWRFARAFPHVVRLSASDGLARTMQRASALLASILFTCNAIAYVVAPAQPWSVRAVGLLARPHPSGLYWLLEFGLAACALATIVWRSREAADAERRRVMAFAIALAAGMGPLLLIVLMEYISASARQLIEGPWLYLVGYLIYVPMATLPFSTSYSLAAARLPPAGAVFSRVARFLLAPRALLGLLVGPLAVLSFFVYLNREKNTAVVLGGPLARALLAITVVGAVALYLRERFGGRLPVEARTSSLVIELAAAARAAPTLLGAAEAVALRVRDAAAVESVTLFGRSEGRRRFEPLREGLRALPAESAIGVLAEESDEALLTDPGDPQSVFEWLPSGDQEWVLDNKVAAVAGMRGGAARLIGVLVATARHDGAHWTRADAAVLTAAAGAAALALEPRGLGRGSVDLPIAEGSTVECVRCGNVRKPAERRCWCGGALKESLLPELLRGKFRVERVVGRGGMGVVYLATDLDLGRRVALKTLPRVTTGAAVRLRQEARSMASWVHPHLAVIFGAESWRGLPVLVVEYLEGGTLLTRLPGPLPPRDVLGWGVLLANALEAMHERGMLHRDVKPSNIGFTAAGVPKLLDFGLAKLVDVETAPGPAAPAVADSEAPAREGNLTATGRVVGTPLYMSPNASAGGRPGPADDLWSLTLVLYEAIAGRRDWAPGSPSPAVAQTLGEPLTQWFATALSPHGVPTYPTGARLRLELERLITFFR